MKNNSKKLFVFLFFRKLFKFLPSLFWIFLIFAFDTPSIAITTLICAVIHEAGHIIALYVLKKSGRISSSLTGLRISDFGVLRYGEELTVAAAGPAVNLLFFLFSLPFSNLANGYIGIFGVINLLTAISNLLPIESYDGSRILRCLLSIFGREKTADVLSRVISFALCSLLCIISLYLMGKLDAGYFIFFVFLGILLKNMKV